MNFELAWLKVVLSAKESPRKGLCAGIRTDLAVMRFFGLRLRSREWQ